MKSILALDSKLMQEVSASLALTVVAGSTLKQSKSMKEYALRPQAKKESI